MWRSRDPVLDRETVDGIIRKLMEMDDKLNRILKELDAEDEEEEDT